MYGFSVIITDTRDHRITVMDQVAMAVAVVAVEVILPRISHRVILEVVVTQEMVTPTIGGRTKITDGTTIEDRRRRQTPTPSASFFLGCDTVSKPFCV